MNSIQLESNEQGVVLPVKARAGANANRIVGFHDGALKVTVTQVAEKGKANRAIIKLLAKGLPVAPSNMSLVAGSTQANKRFVVAGVSVAQVETALQTHLNPPKH